MHRPTHTHHEEEISRTPPRGLVDRRESAAQNRDALKSALGEREQRVLRARVHVDEAVQPLQLARDEFLALGRDDEIRRIDACLAVCDSIARRA